MSRVVVCPLSAVDQVLKESDARWMLSLSAPGKSPTRPGQIDGDFLAVEFNDIAEERDGLVAPNLTHLEALLGFVRRWNGDGSMLIHCWLGISRSTAAAVIAQAAFDPDQDMNHLALQLRQYSPMATPNPLMISIADDCWRWMVGWLMQSGPSVAARKPWKEDRFRSR